MASCSLPLPLSRFLKRELRMCEQDGFESVRRHHARVDSGANLGVGLKATGVVAVAVIVEHDASAGGQQIAVVVKVRDHLVIRMITVHEDKRRARLRGIKGSPISLPFVKPKRFRRRFSLCRVERR